MLLSKVGPLQVPAVVFEACSCSPTQQPRSVTSVLQQVRAAGSAGQDAVGPLQHELARQRGQGGHCLGHQLRGVDVPLDHLYQLRHLLQMGQRGTSDTYQSTVWSSVNC